MRRRKARVVWLPQTNSNSVDATNRSTWSIATVAAPAAGPPGVIEVPIVQDGIASDPLNPNSSLADIEGSGYRLRRIVGKIYCFIAQTQSSGEDIWGVTAGFIVRRIDPSTGAAVAAFAGNTNIDPSDIENGMDPWIWRRSWLLSNYEISTSITATTGGQDSTWVHSAGGANYGRLYPGGNAEGPHVDQKTARIVGPEERLFLDVSATPIIASQDTSLVVIYEMRVLASMRTNIGNRRNASR